MATVMIVGSDTIAKAPIHALRDEGHIIRIRPTYDMLPMEPMLPMADDRVHTLLSQARPTAYHATRNKSDRKRNRANRWR